MTDLSLRMWRVTFTDGTEFITWANCVAAAEVLAKKEYTQSEIDYVWQDCGEEAQPGLYTEGRDLNELRARIADLEQALKDETHTRKLCADRMREGRERIKELEKAFRDYVDGERDAWQPIETAPHEMPVLAYDPRWCLMPHPMIFKVATRNPTSGTWVLWRCGTGPMKPTHWQPLPKPPEKK